MRNAMYVRLFSRILDSSINMQSVAPAYRWLWIAMLIIADEDGTGVVDLPIERLASRAGLSIEDTVAGIEFFMSPDSESHSDDEGGRRIVPIRESGRGWRLVNWQAYKDILNREQAKEQTRARVAKFRSKKRSEKLGNAEVTKSNASYSDSNAEATPEPFQRQEAKISKGQFIYLATQVGKWNDEHQDLYIGGDGAAYSRAFKKRFSMAPEKFKELQEQFG